MAKLVFEENVLPLDQWREALFEQLPRDDLVATIRTGPPHLILVP